MKIFAPNGKYGGTTASVPFRDGVGETDNPRLLAWFAEHGYTVEDDGAQSEQYAYYDKMTVKDLKEIAADEGIDLGKLTAKGDIIARIIEATKGADGKGGEANGQPEGAGTTQT